MVIVDTSVALKWFFPEEGSEEAKRILLQDVLGAPDLLRYELTNVLTNQKIFSLGDCHKMLELLFSFRMQFFVLPEKSFFRILELCYTFKITAYDASFIALAESLQTQFVTADLKLARKVKTLPFVVSLLPL